MPVSIVIRHGRVHREIESALDDLQFHADQPLDSSKVSQLVVIAERDGNAGRASPTRAPDSVHVGLGNVGHVVVDHVGDLVRVDAARDARDVELAAIDGVDADAVWISAETGEGFDALRKLMRESWFGGPIGEAPLVTHARHAEALKQAEAALDRALAAAVKNVSDECVLEDLREAMDRLGETTGAFSTDDLYDRVFSKFCIGK